MYTMYYNKENEFLIITSNITFNEIIRKNEGENIYFYNEKEEIIGANIKIKLEKVGLITYEDIKDLNFKVELKEKIKNNNTNFKYGKIISYDEHPESTKLKVCKVNDGEEKQIICGAKNVEIGKIAIVAQIGTTMPNGKIINESKLLGVESYGMLCSLQELGYNQEEPGIFLSNDENLVGMEFKGL